MHVSAFFSYTSGESMLSNLQERSVSMLEESKGAAIMTGSMFDGLSPLPADAAVTMAYVPFQINKEMFGDDEALCKGTLFKTLNKPFLRGAFK